MTRIGRGGGHFVMTIAVGCRDMETERREEKQITGWRKQRDETGSKDVT